MRFVRTIALGPRFHSTSGLRLNRCISGQVGYDIMHCNNDDIKPINSLESDAQKIVIFDDFIFDKNHKPLIDYFIQGRHKNCSVIYLLQSFYKTPKDIRLNCSHYVIYDFQAGMKEI